MQSYEKQRKLENRCNIFEKTNIKAHRMMHFAIGAEKSTKLKGSVFFSISGSVGDAFAAII